jgi:phosphatidylserine/phosphatidylglycerophosphate/cardiolipin synthase-like enzyme
MLYERVIREGLMRARRSVWIATANVKELLVERHPPRRGYGSILGVFDDLVQSGVELRLLYAEIPSRRFRAQFDRRRRLVKGGLAMKQCPRVHLKTVIVDGTYAYLGSANLTGAGLGAKGENRRNFELGFWTEDFAILDEVQALYERLWQGEPCHACGLRDICPDPGAYKAA